MHQHYQQTPRGLLLPEQALDMKGVFHVQHIRAGEVIDEFDAPNLVVNQGRTHVLNTVFRSQPQITQWYCGLFRGNYTPVATDEAATFAASSTEMTDYTLATRPEWTPGSVVSNAVNNAAARASFTFNVARSVFGAFLVSDQVKGGTGGTLMAAARFANSRAVAVDDQLLLTYTISAAT